MGLRDPVLEPPQTLSPGEQGGFLLSAFAPLASRLPATACSHPRRSFAPSKPRGPVKLPRSSGLSVGMAPLSREGARCSGRALALSCAWVLGRCCSRSQTCPRKTTRTGSILVFPVWFFSAGLCGFGFQTSRNLGGSVSVCSSCLAGQGAQRLCRREMRLSNQYGSVGLPARHQGCGCCSLETAPGCHPLSSTGTNAGTGAWTR